MSVFITPRPRVAALKLGVRALARLSAGDDFSLTAREGIVVHAEGHGGGRLLDADGGKRPGVGRVGDGVADPRLDPGDGDDVAGRGLVDLLAREPIKGEELRDLGRREAALVIDARDGLALTERAALQATHGDPADVVVVRRRGHEQLRRRRWVDVGPRYPVDDRVEQRLERRA